jgi:hypothetical protein
MMPAPIITMSARCSLGGSRCGVSGIVGEGEVLKWFGQLREGVYVATTPMAEREWSDQGFGFYTLFVVELLC